MGNEDINKGNEEKEDFIDKIKTVKIDRRLFVKYTSMVAATAALGSTMLWGCGSNNEGKPGSSGGGSTAGGVAPGGASGLIIKKGSPMVTIFTSLDNDYYADWSVGAEQCVKALGMNYERYACEFKAEQLISQFENKAVQGVKVFFLGPPDPSPIPRVCEIAKQYQAHFTVTWESPDWFHPIEGGDYYVSFFLPPGLKAAYDMAKILFDAMGGKGNLIHITGIPGNTPDLMRTMGVDLALKEYPNIKLIERQNGRWNRIDSRKVMEDLISKHKQIEGVFGQNDGCALGALSALEDHGIKGVPIVGIDGSKEALDRIKEGRMTGTNSSIPQWQAGYSAVAAFDAANGWKPSVPERMMWTGTINITKKNVDSYYKTFIENKILPYDWELMSKVLHPNDWDPQNEVYPMDPNELWAPMKKPANFKGLPPQVQEAKDKGEFESIKRLYADHWKKKPF
ncbi:MAG: sugar ABC transporter substrate-binding protein [Firmicutes bacterium]|nr:sugar ABC transporter substrate-binding protein [Bacillota bacterium]